ncbi:cation:proton antiporter [Nocardiopsis rhodophaea]|uniref:cation:proton antiporter n=1 Tax=Nocardiopsis rhodophaea TaxID=280238 RepID=UPI0031DDC0BE
MDAEMAETLRILVIIMAAAVLAPLISDHVGRWVVVPAVVLEIALGILLGPDGLALIHETDVIYAFADLGLAMLMFMAGYEIDFNRIKGRPLRRAALAWLCSLALGLGAAWTVFGSSQTTLIIGLALTTTALGTVLPILRDAGALSTAFGTRFLASGTVGEFGPIVVIALLLSGFRPLEGTLLLLVFFAVAGLAAWRATRPTSERMGRLIRATLGTSAQLAVRLSLFVIVAMVGLAGVLQLDTLLGAFAAGIIVRLMLMINHPQEVHEVESKLEAVSFGLFIPVFFVVTGVRFDVGALASDVGAVLLLPLFLLLFLLVRGLPELLLSRDGLAARQRPALALFAATALPLLVVLTTIGGEAGVVEPAVAAALVGAGMLSVLVLPLIGLRLWRSSQAAEEAPSVARG